MSYRKRTGPEVAHTRRLVRLWLLAGGYTHRGAADVVKRTHTVIHDWLTGRSSPNALDIQIIQQDILAHGGEIVEQEKGQGRAAPSPKKGIVQN